ncbi:MAG: nitrous oxide reductase family maturation protein NosD [Rhodobacterales bacterium]|nr:nitrous oxide reductase family maturation protein NosD [Rhodobacterales bacterium]
MAARVLLVVGLVLGLVPAAFGLPAAKPQPGLQDMVDAAAKGDVVAPPPGTYAGPVVIDKPLTLDGQDGAVTIDAGGKGSVLILDTDGATVRGLHLVNSGDSHNDIDAGIQVRGNYNVIKDNRIENTLFGVDLSKSHNNVVRRNVIRGKDFHLGVRGDAIRLWYSRNNKIEQNDIALTRDSVIWYSVDNVLSGNTFRGGRYGTHFMYSQYNLVKDNTYEGNSVGIFLMYSDGVVVRDNHISHGQGATGMGVGLKESSDVTIAGNDIVYCATGIYTDVSPFQPDTLNRMYDNRIAFNSIGILFHNDWTGNVLRDNIFESNYVQVSVNAKASAARNDWAGNHWDDYRGFDRDGDGVGDTPHEMRVYADRIWMDVPHASFFRAAPSLTLIDFLERLAPFSEPILLLRDDKPKMRADGPRVAERPDVDAAGAGRADDDEGEGRIDPFNLKGRVYKDKE